ncbi:hypothetical protein L6164_008114 [Bauhinia variegata]|uniref:Uncharacterized protein n=1 Tax=Bauhinia variegata TaxID=167791 RepID=A0ACB9PEQ6_BAUVA|nr:hypothetical protein L6164_008114 [Bauhinia variegata]
MSFLIVGFVVVNEFFTWVLVILIRSLSIPILCGDMALKGETKASSGVFSCGEKLGCVIILVVTSVIQYHPLSLCPDLRCEFPVMITSPVLVAV